VGAALDSLIGDPSNWPHPVRLIGSVIASGEKIARQYLGEHELVAGSLLSVGVVGASFAATRTLLWAVGRVSPLLAVGLGALISSQCVAARCLADEAEHVRALLAAGRLQEAREAVAMLVGRDTHNLDEAGVARACVETVAENASDGVVAPLLYLALGGPAAGLGYKAVNTLDSMIGYHNERYELFGRFAATLDDVLNFVPARLCGVTMVAASALLRLDWRSSWTALQSDRLNHASPNSAHGEAACAGALCVRLGGPSTYSGVAHDKPFINASGAAVVHEDIRRANQLMLVTEGLCVAAIGLVGALASRSRRKS
jgi:adenosylcobinamide-phosphate synthase